jgi:hypothetical protein
VADERAPRPFLRVVAIDGVVLDDAPPPSEGELEDLQVERQRREIRLAKETLRRLRAGR